MSWFGPKLEPGERILLRDPALRNPWEVILSAMAVTAVMTAYDNGST